MKKFLVMLLCLMMVSASALAGTMPVEVQKLTDTKTLVYLVPEGAKDYKLEDIYDMKFITVEMNDEAMPEYYIIVSYSDVLHEKDITDLSDEELAAVVSYTAADSEEHAYEVIEMEDGWPGVLVKYEGESDWVDAFTIISGYIIQVHGAHSDFAEMTDAEMDFAFTLLDSMDVVDAE